jgi:hypothetical protein
MRPRSCREAIAASLMARGPVAQLVEHFPYKEGVVGSRPAGPTRDLRRQRRPCSPCAPIHAPIGARIPVARRRRP